MKTGFIGGGNMAEALLAGLLAKAVCLPDEVLVSDCNAARLQLLHGRYRVEALARNRPVVERSEMVILAVKPQNLDAVLEELVPVAAGRLFVSIAAGRQLAYFSERLPGARVVRVMPNLACQVGEGMSAYCRGDAATGTDTAWVRRMLESCGRVVELDESCFDIVTALSGSGPAFFAFMLQALVEAAVQRGMPTETAQELALQTMRGAATVMMKRGVAPVDFIASVASKGGTTAAGLAVLENSDFRAVVRETLDAAAERSAQLSA